jgi:hypothetical protein
MQQTVHKIKHIPTEYNFYMIQHKQLKRLQTQVFINRLLIIALLITTAFIGLQMPSNKINAPQTTATESQETVNLEAIPTAQLK